jgi:hypothetical protein
MRAAYIDLAAVQAHPTEHQQQHDDDQDQQ